MIHSTIARIWDEDQYQKVEIQYLIERGLIMECKVITPITVEPSDLTTDVVDAIRNNESDHRLRIDCEIEYTITAEMIRVCKEND